MERTRMKAEDFPTEVLTLFDQYVHGLIDRRGFLDGAAKFTAGGMTASMFLDALSPEYAWVAQVAEDDEDHQPKRDMAEAAQRQVNAHQEGLVRQGIEKRAD